MSSFLAKIEKQQVTADLSTIVDAATEAVINVWKQAANRQVSSGEKDRLHSVLEDFFADSKYAWFDKQDEEE